MHHTHAAAERPALTIPLVLFTCILVLVVAAGCGRDRGARVEAGAPAIRTPLPTFTPTQYVQAGAAGQPAPAAPQPVAVAPAAPAGSTGQEASAVQPVDAAQSLPALPTATTMPPGIGGPVNPASAVGDPSEAAAAAAVAPVAAVVDPPLGIVNTELVNGRAAPDTNADVVLVLGRGETYDITGRNGDGAWWRLCCYQGQEVWAKAEFIDNDGPVDGLPVAQGGETSDYAIAMLTATAQPPAPEVASAAPTPEPPASVAPVSAPEAAPAAEAAPAQPAEALAADPAAAAVAADTVAAADDAPAFEFDLTGQESFPETNVVRVFLYTFAENLALEGYSLRVRKDGVEQAVSGESWGGQPGLTWPIADERQRFQNYKVEFPGVTPAGTWTVELTHGGAVVGPMATFTLAADEPNRELYVRYARR